MWFNNGPPYNNYNYPQHPFVFNMPPPPKSKSEIKEFIKFWQGLEGLKEDKKKNEKKDEPKKPMLTVLQAATLMFIIGFISMPLIVTLWVNSFVSAIKTLRPLLQ